MSYYVSDLKPFYALMNMSSPNELVLRNRRTNRFRVISFVFYYLRQLYLGPKRIGIFDLTTISSSRLTVSIVGFHCHLVSVPLYRFLSSHVWRYSPSVALPVVGKEGYRSILIALQLLFFPSRASVFSVRLENERLSIHTTRIKSTAARRSSFPPSR